MGRRGEARIRMCRLLLTGCPGIATPVGELWRDGAVQTQGIVNAVIAGLIMLLLYSPRANEFFRTN